MMPLFDKKPTKVDGVLYGIFGVGIVVFATAVCGMAASLVFNT